MLARAPTVATARGWLGGRLQQRVAGWVAYAARVPRELAREPRCSSDTLRQRNAATRLSACGCRGSARPALPTLLLVAQVGCSSLRFAADAPGGRSAQAAIPTLQYLTSKGAKVMLTSHLVRRRPRGRRPCWGFPEPLVSCLFCARCRAARQPAAPAAGPGLRKLRRKRAARRFPPRAAGAAIGHHRSRAVLAAHDVRCDRSGTIGARLRIGRFARASLAPGVRLCRPARLRRARALPRAPRAGPRGRRTSTAWRRCTSACSSCWPACRCCTWCAPSVMAFALLRAIALLPALHLLTRYPLRFFAG